MGINPRPHCGPLLRTFGKTGPGNYQWFRTRKVDWLSTSSCHINKGGSRALSPPSFRCQSIISGKGAVLFMVARKEPSGQDTAQGTHSLWSVPPTRSFLLLSTEQPPSSNHPPDGLYPITCAQVWVGAGALSLRWFHQTDSTKWKRDFQELGTGAHMTIGNFTKLWLPYIMHTYVRIRKKQYKLTFSIMNSVKYKYINKWLFKITELSCENRAGEKAQICHKSRDLQDPEKLSGKRNGFM